MIQSLLSISDYCTPTAKHLIKATIKTIPGRLGVLGETILTGMKFMSYAKYTGYAIVAGAAGIAAPLMIDFSGELLTKLGYPTNIDMTVKGALIADVQMLLGATPFYGHNDEISLTQNPLSLLGFQTGESPLIRDYGSLRTVELDKIIANMRLVVQVNNGGVQSDLNAAARSYANQLSRLFSPHINITTDF